MPTHLVTAWAILERALPDSQGMAFSFLPSTFIEHVLNGMPSWNMGQEKERDGIVRGLHTSPKDLPTKRA